MSGDRFLRGLQDSGASMSEDAADEASRRPSASSYHGTERLWDSPLSNASSAASSDVEDDGLTTVWTRSTAAAAAGAEPGSAGQPGPSGSSSTSSELVSVEEAGTSAAKNKATPTGLFGKSRSRKAARKGPQRCSRCGRFLKKESWISTITRTVSKTLTRTPWGRYPECTSCDRPFRRSRFRRGRRLSRARTARRASSRRKSRSRRRRGYRSRSRRSRSRSRRGRRRRRRNLDDHKFFVC